MGSRPGRAIPKALKMVLESPLLTLALKRVVLGDKVRLIYLYLFLLVMRVMEIFHWFYGPNITISFYSCSFVYK